MIATEWNLEDAIKVAQEEAWEDGMEKGMEKGMENGQKLFSGLMEQAKSIDDLRQMFEATFTRQS